MTVAISTDAAQSGWLKIRLLGNAVAAGIVGSVANPEGVPLQIVRGVLYFGTASTAAATFNIGIGASAVGNYNDLMSAFAMNQVATTVWQVVGQDLASEGAAVSPQGLLWPATSFLTVTSAAFVSTGLVADLFLQYTRLSSA